MAKVCGWMKKGKLRLVGCYIAACLLYLAGILSFAFGTDYSMAVIWLILGSLCLWQGSSKPKEEE